MHRFAVVVTLIVANAMLVVSAWAAPAGRVTTLATPGTPDNVQLAGHDPASGTLWFTTTASIAGTPDPPANTDNDIYRRTPAGVFELVSSPSADNANYFGASTDGTVIWFSTLVQLTPADTDAGEDIYEARVGAPLRLVSPGSGAQPALFHSGSPDGSRVWFHTNESLDPADTDGARDVYQANANGTTILISGGTAPVNAELRGATPNGSHVWFHTTESLVPADPPGNTDTDVYEYTGTTLRLISSGAGNTSSVWRGASADGQRVWFETQDPIVATGDTTFDVDIYERKADDSIRLISSPSVDNAIFRRATSDGAKVWFETSEAVPGTDDPVTNTDFDVFERSVDGSLRLAGSPAAGNEGLVHANADGSTLWISAAASLSPSDTDTQNDIYEIANGGTPRLVSAGNGPFEASFKAASSDGARVFFTTGEAVPTTGDSDTAQDVYETFAGITRLVSAGSSNDSDVNFIGASLDGRTVWIETDEALTPTDTDTLVDLYAVTLAAPEVSTPTTTTGGATVGSVRTCTAGTFAGIELSAPTLQWLRGGVAVPGATGATYTVLATDAGLALSCRSTVTNPTGSTSSESTAVAVAPFVQARAVVRGFPIVGQRVSCPATVPGSTTRTVRWKRGTRTVGTAATYLLRLADRGKRITCTVTGTGPGGAVSSTSVARLVPAVCRVPRVRGVTRAVALTRVGNAGCRSRVVLVTETGVQRGRALATVPAAGAVLPNGARVTIRVRR